jgi:hypothetical protein
MPVELLNEVADDAETVVIAWLKPLLSDGNVANTRKSGAPLPFILVNHLESSECVEESSVDSLVSVHVLTHKAAGEVDSRDQTLDMHRRMLLLARYLEDVDLAGGRKATIDYVDVAMSPKREPYGDDQILRRVARYNIGFSYAEVQ